MRKLKTSGRAAGKVKEFIPVEVVGKPKEEPGKIELYYKEAYRMVLSTGFDDEVLKRILKVITGEVC